jgi:hypothetical protein
VRSHRNRQAWQRERRRVAAESGREQVDELPRALAVAQAELGTTLLHCFGAILFGFAGPARENLRVVGDAGAVVVFSLVVDRHGTSSSAAL